MAMYESHRRGKRHVAARSSGRAPLRRWAAGGVAAAMLLAACGADDDGDDAPATEEDASDVAVGEAAGEIRFSFWGLPEEVSVQEQLKEAFEEQQSDVTVDLHHVSEAGEFVSQMLTQIAGGNPPDVHYIGETRVPSFADRGAILDLMPYVERDDLDLDAFFDRVITPVMDDEGHLWAFAKDTTAFMFYYNKTLFDEAGVDHPSIDWTWDDMVAAAEALTQDTSGDGRIDQWGLGLGTGWPTWVSAVLSNGGQILNEERNQCLLDQPEAYEAIQRMADLMHEDPIVAPSPEIITGMDVGTIDMFNGGQAAMFDAGRWGAFFAEGLDDAYEWGVAPFPYMSEPRTSALFVTLAIPHNASNPDAAWEFIKFVLSEEGQRINAATGLGLPVLEDLADDATSWLLEDEPEEHVEIYTESLAERAVDLPYHPQWDETIDEIAARELDTVWLGQRSAEDATAAICAEIDPIIADN
jgi:multiple sugar transport system substrate-binding protein